MTGHERDEPWIGRRRSVVVAAGTLALVAVVAGVVLPRFADYGAAWDAATGFSGFGLTGLAIATVVNVVVYAFPLSSALPELRIREAFIVQQTSFAISNAVPAGGAVMPATAYAMLAGYGIVAARAVAAVGIVAAWNIAVTVVLPLVALALLAAVDGSATTGLLTSVVGLGVTVVVVASTVIALRSDDAARSLGRQLDRTAQAIARWLRRDVDIDIGTALVRFRGSSSDILARRWLPITAASVAIHLASFAVLYVAMAGIGDPLPVTRAFAAFALARVATLIPVTPGGLGTVDAALASLLTGFGMAGSDALAAVLIWRVATFLPSVVLGLAAFGSWRRDVATRSTPPSREA